MTEKNPTTDEIYEDRKNRRILNLLYVTDLRLNMWKSQGLIPCYYEDGKNGNLGIVEITKPIDAGKNRVLRVYLFTTEQYNLVKNLISKTKDVIDASKEKIDILSTQFIPAVIHDNILKEKPPGFIS